MLCLAILNKRIYFAGRCLNHDVQVVLRPDSPITFDIACDRRTNTRAYQGWQHPNNSSGLAAVLKLVDLDVIIPQC